MASLNDITPEFCEITQEINENGEFEYFVRVLGEEQKIKLSRFLLDIFKSSPLVSSIYDLRTYQTNYFKYKAKSMLNHAKREEKKIDGYLKILGKEVKEL